MNAIIMIQYVENFTFIRKERVCGFNVKRGGLENSRGVVHFYNLSPFD